MRMDSASPSSGTFFTERISAQNFPDWVRFLRTLKDPNDIRNGLYFGFQPLYDRLVEGNVEQIARKDAILGLDAIMNASKAFLSSYYLGKPDIERFKDSIDEIGWYVSSLGLGLPYVVKNRNIDRIIHSEQVHGFLKTFIGHIVDGNVPKPDYIVGCACGSSEVVFALSGIINVGFGLMRRSFRRNDDIVRIVAEHEAAIGVGIKGSSVVCVEDYVGTGKSLASIIEAVNVHSPISVIGASIIGSYTDVNLEHKLSSPDFNAYAHYE